MKQDDIGKYSTTRPDKARPEKKRVDVLARYGQEPRRSCRLKVPGNNPAVEAAFI
jgi:hypothetical protein